jgi:hypothetical protein
MGCGRTKVPANKTASIGEEVKKAVDGSRPEV